MEAEKPTIPNDAEAKEANYSPSESTIDASHNVARSLIEERVNNGAVGMLLDHVSQEVKEQGMPLIPGEKTGWRRFMKRFFHHAQASINEKPLPEKTKGALKEFIDWLPDYLGEVRKVSDRYGFTTSAGPKLRFWQGALGAVAAVDGVGPQYVAWNLLNKEAARENQAVAHWNAAGGNQDAFNAMNGPEKNRVLLRRIKADAQLGRSTLRNTKEGERVYAKSLLRDYLPFAFSLVGIPLARLSGTVREQFGKEMISVEKNLNRRIANSLLMRNYEFLQDAAPTDMVKTIERGRWSVVTLMSTTYLEVWPRLISSVAALASQTVSNKLVGTLSLLRIPFYVSAAKEHIDEGRKWRREEAGKQSGMERMIGSIFRSVELVKTDDVEHTAEKLAGALDARDEVLRGRDRDLSDREKKHLTTTKVFDYGVPSVSALTQLIGKLMPAAHPMPDVLSAGTKRQVQRERFLSGLSRTPRNAASELRRMTPSKAIIEGSQLLNTLFTADRTQNVIKGNINALVGLYTGSLKNAVEESKRFEEFLSQADPTDMPGGEKELTRIPIDGLENLDIHIDRLNFENILKDITLEVPQGTFFTIKGPKGIGKTTLMRAMMGLYSRDSGAVSYGGVAIKDIKKYGDQALNTKIGYANQSPQFFEGMTLKENLLLWSRREVPDEQVRSVLTDLGMEKFVDDINSNKKFYFSGGELRMIGLARALLKNPQVLFLDEPTSNLDQESARKVMEVIQSLRAKKPEMTVVAITHDPNFEEIAERVVDFRGLNNTSDILSENQVYEAVAEPE